jgi:hypothetical protein
MKGDGEEQQLVTQNGDFRPALFDRVPQGVIRWSPDSTQLQFKDRWSTPPFLYSVNIETRSVNKSVTAKEPDIMQRPLPGSPTALPCAVPTFNQKNYNDNMRTCNISIAGAGCAVTSAAMILKYYGVNTDPPTLNACLGNSACPLYWGTVASNCSSNKVSGAGFQLGFSYNTINTDLAAGKPVIVWVSKPGGTHYVVVTGGSGNTPGGYTINDPADGSSNKTLANYVNAGWSLSQINRYSGTPSCGEGGPINYGDTKNGTISPAYNTDDYTFNGTAGDVVEIRQNKNGSSLDSYVELFGPNNYYAFDDDGGGSYNSFLRRTLPTSGQYRIRAKAYAASTGAYTLNLVKVAVPNGDSEGDPRYIAFEQTLNGTINPINDQDTYYFNGTNGRVISIRMNATGGGVDTYLELYSPSGTFLKSNDDGGGGTNSWLVQTLTADGTYRIVARSYSNASSGTYTIKLESVTGGGGSGNLARNKGVATSSVEFSGVEGWKATDGNTGTRWSSQFSDPQWIYIDLGQNRSFNQVVLRWEAAYGRRFGIYYQSTSMCSSCWNNVYWTDNGNGGTNTINFSSVTGRYVLMYGIARGTPWGYSLYEFEVYDTTTTTVPDVPPDDPGKVDTGSVSPLPPTDGGKDVLAGGEGEYGQETMPLAAGDALTVTGQTTATQTVLAFINSPDEGGLYKLSTTDGSILFDGLASSQVGTATIPITGYNWWSDRNGNIGSQETFTLPVTVLLPGWHTIYFKAQNELGTWSEVVTTTLNVEWPYQTYLPMVIR